MKTGCYFKVISRKSEILSMSYLCRVKVSNHWIERLYKTIVKIHISATYSLFIKESSMKYVRSDFVILEPLSRLSVETRFLATAPSALVRAYRRYFLKKIWRRYILWITINQRTTNSVTNKETAVQSYQKMTILNSKKTLG